MKPLSYRHTVTASCLGSVTMSVTNNLPPLLFVIFHEDLGVPFGQITLLITLNFVLQLTVDLLAALFADRIGYRPLLVGAAVLSALGLVALATLPRMMTPILGLLIADVLYALGSGLGEAIISPTVEACPMKNKAGMMGFLHSFYCWGTVAVILLSTAFLAVFGEGLFWLLPLLWALLPAANAVLFCLVPIPELERVEKGSEERAGGSLLRRPLFWLFLVLMAAAGAAEQSMNQWASAFAEVGLGVTKTVGDLVGPCLFALLMGIARLVFAFSKRLNLGLFLLFSSGFAVGAYLLASLSSSPVLSLIGCALTGLGVGALWPGLLSLAADRFPKGGTLLFSLCALFGDLGCSLGPTLVGMTAEGGTLADGLLLASLFPALLFVGLALLEFTKKKDRM